MKHRPGFLLVPLAATVLAGCATLVPLRRPNPMQGAGVGMKEVVEKREPNYLIAVDRTECVVSRSRFNKVERGSRVLCRWT